MEVKDCSQLTSTNFWSFSTPSSPNQLSSTFDDPSPNLTLFRLGFGGLLRTGGDIFIPPSNSSSSNRITLKFCIGVTYDKIFTHTKIWTDDVIFDDDVSIFVIFTANLCDWFYQYFIKILIFFFFRSNYKYQKFNRKSKL